MSRIIITHLSGRERYLIEEKLGKGNKIAKIANELGRDKSTIYREIKRSGFNYINYRSLAAEDKYAERKFKKKETLKFSNQKLLKDKELFKKVFLL